MVISDMWIFGRHRHLKLELLSEYLDGRLDTAAQARVTRQLDSCDLCRNEVDSLQSTVSLLQALPELTATRSFTLAAAPISRPVIVRQPLPLRAPSWAYAGAASLAGLALAIMVSADTLGLLAPIAQTGISNQTAERSVQSLPPAAAPEAGLSAAMPTSEPLVTSSEALAADQPEPTAVPAADSIQAPRVAEELPDSVKISPGLAPPAADAQPETMALAVEAIPGVDGSATGAAGAAGPAGATDATDATELQDNPIEGTGFSEKPANQSEDAIANSQSAVDDQSVDEVDPALAVDLSLSRYEGTPIVWRVLEGITTVVILALLSILVVKRLMSRRIDG